MRKSSPKHLEPRRRASAAWRGRLRLASVSATGVALLALLVAGYGQGQGGRPGRAAPEPRAGAHASQTTRPGPTTTSRRPLAGPLAGPLADPGFEAGLGAWRPLGGARLARLAAGRGGGAAALLRAGRDEEPGLVLAGIGRARAGVTYEGQVWVRASTPGQVVEVRLAEVVAGNRLAATDTVGVVLTDTAWRRVEVSHTAHGEGAQLSLQVVAPALGPSGRLLVDDVRVR